MTQTSIHLPTTLTLDQYRTVAECVVRVLRDSNRTEDIITAEELTAQAQLVYLQTSGVMQTGDGPDLMRERPDFVNVDMDALRALPPETLGGALARFFSMSALASWISGTSKQTWCCPPFGFFSRKLMIGDFLGAEIGRAHV